MAHTALGGVHPYALSVLVVDDNKSTVDIIERLLKAAGIKRVKHASDGKAALQVLKDWRPSVIISDWKMQPMDGKTFLQSIKSGPDGLSDVPVIVATGYSNKEVITEAVNGGAQQILAKPIAPATLYNKLDMVLKRSMNAMKDPLSGPQKNPENVATPVIPQPIEIEEDDDEAWQI